PSRTSPPDERRGKAAIRAGVEERRAAGIQGPGTNTRHLNTTMAVDHDGGDTAVVTSYFQYFTDTATQPTLRVMGCYRHTVVRTPGSASRRPPSRLPIWARPRSRRSPPPEPVPDRGERSRLRLASVHESAVSAPRAPRRGADPRRHLDHHGSAGVTDPRRSRRR